MIERLAGRRRPLVLMGDFNCGFSTKDRTLSMLAHELGLQAHEPEATDMASFPSRNKRFDWIMISAEFTFLGASNPVARAFRPSAVVATLGLARPEHVTGALRCGRAAKWTFVIPGDTSIRIGCHVPRLRGHARPALRFGRAWHPNRLPEIAKSI